MRVVVLRGGPSAEHDISLSTGQAMLDNLDNARYEAQDVVISRDGDWNVDGQMLDAQAAIAKLKDLQTDVVLLGLHGTFGEDGTVQKMLEDAGLAYTGSDSDSSRLAMDKDDSNEAYEKAGLPVPKTIVIASSELETRITDITENLDLPVIVKPVSQGSSVGVHLVEKDSELSGALHDAAKHDSEIMVQEFIKGREVSCGVLENQGELSPLPPTELILVNRSFFDFEAKYTAGATNEVTPPDMPEETLSDIQQKAVQAHKALGCRSYSRTDMIVDEKGTCYMIETNTLPGMTATSILPQQAEASGMSFAQLLDRIIQNAKV